MDPRRVLVIEDDPAVRLALEVFLSAEPGVGEVTTAADGDQGVQAAADFSPNVIVTDSTMPGKSGDELGRSLRALCPSATIISFSGILNTAPWADHRIQKGGPDTFDALAGAVTGGERVDASDATIEMPSGEDAERRRKLHDLRNCLTPLTGYASLLESGADDLQADQVRDIARRMNQAIDRVNRLLSEF